MMNAITYTLGVFLTVILTWAAVLLFGSSSSSDADAAPVAAQHDLPGISEASTSLPEDPARIMLYEIGRYDEFDRFSVDVVYVEQVTMRGPDDLWSLCRKAVPQHVTVSSGAPASPPVCIRITPEEAADLLGS